MDKPEVKVGQVWRERDSRFTRYVRIDDRAFKDREPAMWVQPCSVSGALMRRGKTTRIKTANLQKRFELVKDVEQLSAEQ